MKKFLIYSVLVLFLPVAAFTQSPGYTGMGNRDSNLEYYQSMEPGLRNPFNKPLNEPYRVTMLQFQRPFLQSVLFGFDDIADYPVFMHPSTAYADGKVRVHKPTPRNRFQWEDKTLCAPAQIAVALPFLIIGRDKLDSISW